MRTARPFLPSLLLLLLPLLGHAQGDDYHRDLLAYLSTAFTLPQPTFPLGDNEASINARLSAYTAARSVGTAPDDRDFSRVISLDVPGGLTNRWDAGLVTTNASAIAQGDRLLWVVHLRVREAGGGRVAVIAERLPDFRKEVDVTVELTDEWRRYFIPFEVNSGPYPPGRMNIGLHLGFQEQTVEVGGFTLLNYGQAVSLDQLPNDLDAEEYGGFEPDAPWRAPAAARIDSLRRGDFTIVLRDGDEVLAGTRVQCSMEQHAFDFGTAIKSRRFPGGSGFTDQYYNTVRDLDGRGHGFNAMTPENDLKWPGWEQEWEAPNEQTLRTIDLLADRVHLRGHNLVWPGWDNLPDDLLANRSDLDYLQRRIDDHLVDFLQTKDFDAQITDWDVLNEVTTNTDLADRLAGTPGYVTGREIYAEIFERVHELAPAADLYLNDFVTLSLKTRPGDPLYDRLVRNVGELVDAGAPVDGLGFQAHIQSSPNSIYDVLNTWDDFAGRFGLRHKVTEFDLPPNVSEELAAAYLRDFLTATFSHPSMDGFIMWNFWDVDTWANPGANLFRADWSRTPAGDAFVDLVYNDWWTDESLVTDPTGAARFRGFRGDYTVTFDCGGQAVSRTITLDGRTRRVTIDCAGLVTTTPASDFPAGSLTVSPNPAEGPWSVTNATALPLRARLRSAADGRLLWSGPLPVGRTDLPYRPAPGAYLLEFTDGDRRGVERLVAN